MVRSFAEIVSRMAMRAHLSASENVVVGLVGMRAVVRCGSIGANALSAVETQTNVRYAGSVATLLFRASLLIDDKYVEQCEDVQAQRWSGCRGR